MSQVILRRSSLSVSSDFYCASSYWRAIWKRGLSVRLSVRTSVRPSGTFWYCLESPNFVHQLMTESF